jgi:hypothetical protein
MHYGIGHVENKDSDMQTVAAADCAAAASLATNRLAAAALQMGLTKRALAMLAPRDLLAASLEVLLALQLSLLQV